MGHCFTTCYSKEEDRPEEDRISEDMDRISLDKSLKKPRQKIDAGMHMASRKDDGAGTDSRDDCDINSRIE